MAALEIRKDRTPAMLRKLAKETDDVRVARRILAIASALDGMSREDAASSAGMDRQTLRDWQAINEPHLPLSDLDLSSSPHLVWRGATGGTETGTGFCIGGVAADDR